MTYAEWTEVRMQVMYEQELQRLHNVCQMTIDLYSNGKGENEQESSQAADIPTAER